MNAKKRYMQYMKQRGFSNADLLRMDYIAKQSAARQEKEDFERAFIYMLAIPLNILVHDYWSKTAKKRAPKFIDEVLSLFESVQEGVVSNEEIIGLLEDYAGVTVETMWMERKNKDLKEEISKTVQERFNNDRKRISETGDENM